MSEIQENNDTIEQIEDTLLECVNTLRSGADMDSAINELLAIIARFHGADRAYIFEFNDELTIMNNTYEWCGDGVEPEIDVLQNMDISLISRWLTLFEEQGEVYINSLSGEVSKESEEYRILAMQGIESLMAAPLYLNGALIGFLGVDNPKKKTDTLLLLRSVALLVANDIQVRVTLEQKVVGAIGKIYLTMYLINLPKDIQKEYQSNAQVRQYSNSGANAAQQTRDTMNGMVAKESLQEMLEFTDLATLSGRMRETDFISHEFYSVNDRWCRAGFIAVDRGEDGTLNNVLLVVQLIDDEKRKELEYQRSLKLALDNQNEMYGEMLRMLGTGVVAYNVETREIVLMNDVAKEMFGLQEAEGSIRDFYALQDRLVSEDKENFIDRFKTVLREQGHFTCEYVLDNGKRMVHILAYTKIITLGNGQKVSLSSLTDVTEKKILEEQLRNMSRTDVLTQITNRGYGEYQIEELLSQKVPGMFGLFDVDKFKSINDNYGHAVGDKALCAIAECLKKCFRRQDVIMRLGGDEFAVYAVDVRTEEDGGECIKRFFAELDQIVVEGMGNMRISVSLGAVICTGEDGEAFDDLYQKADAAMYICKNSRGNHYGFFRPEMKIE